MGIIVSTRWMAYFRMFLILSDFRLNFITKYVEQFIFIDKENRERLDKKGVFDKLDKRYWKFYSKEIYNGLAMNSIYGVFFDIALMSWMLVLAFSTRCVATVRSFFVYSWNKTFDKEDEDKYAFSQARILRYNLKLREVLINVAVYGVFDTIFVIIGLPAVILRPVAYGRLLELLWYERKEIVSRKVQRVILYQSLVMNNLYAVMDLFFDSCFVLGILLMVRMPFVLKKYSDLLCGDKRDYNKLPHQFGFEKYRAEQKRKTDLLRQQKSAEPLLEDEDEEKKEEIEYPDLEKKEEDKPALDYMECGESVNYEIEDKPFSWNDGDINLFDVRGKNYFVNGKKNKNATVKSDGSLYDIFAVDTFKTATKIKNIAQYYDIDDIIKKREIEMENAENSLLPSLIVISLMFPGNADKNIEGLQMVFFGKNI